MLYKVGLIALLLFGTLTNQNNDKKLNPDFQIATEEGTQVFREELEIALAKTPGANPETRIKFKNEAEKYASELFLKGQKIYRLPQRKLKVYWDSLDPKELARSNDIPFEFSIHLNEVMFFSYHQDHMELVIPHEVAHMLHFQILGYANADHDESFLWVIREIAPGYKYKDIDMTPACRLSSRLLAANGFVGSGPNC